MQSSPKEILRPWVAGSAIMSVLFAFGPFAPTWAEVTLREMSPYQGRNFEWVNTGPSKQGLIGFRALSPSALELSSPLGLSQNAYRSLGQDYVEVFATGADTVRLNLAPSQSLALELSSTSAAPTSPQALFQLGTWSRAPVQAGASALASSDLPALLQSANYYNSAYRYARPDVLGLRGGLGAAGLLDHFAGESQTLIALPSASFTLNNSSAHFDPTVVHSALPWMSLMMAQEFWGVDWQWLLAQWSKETAFMLSTSTAPNWHQSLWTNKDGAFGPGEVEATTYLSRALIYPKFFPYETCMQSHAQIQDANTYQSQCGESEMTFAGRYLGVDHTDPDSAQFVNASLAAVWTLLSNYDLMTRASGLQMKKALYQSTDPDLGLCILLPLYNLGINSGAESALLTSSAKQNWSCADFPTSNGNYRPDILNLAQNLENEAASPQANFYEDWISLDQIRRFYWGENSPALDQMPWTQDGSSQVGGLMKHFNLGSSQKEQLWNAVLGAFNLQSAHWPKQNGTAVISLRYDWLTQLRIAKQFLDLDRGEPQGAEVAQWLAARQKTSVQPLDRRWPFAALALQGSTGDYSVQIRSWEVDAQESGIAKIEWTMDEKWVDWSREHLLLSAGSDTLSKTWTLSIPQSEFQTQKTRGAQNLYVRVLDNSGKAVVLSRALSDTSTAVKTSSFWKTWSLWTRDEFLRQNPHVEQVEIRAVNGAELFAGKFLDLQALQSLPQGSYLFRITGPN